MDKYIKLQARVSSCLNNFFFFFSYIHLCYNYNFAPSKWQVKPLFRRTTCIIHHVLTFFVLPSHPSSLSFLLILPTFCPTSRPLNCLQQQKSSGGFTATWKKKSLMCYITAFAQIPCKLRLYSFSPKWPFPDSAAISVTFLLHWTKLIRGWARCKVAHSVVQEVHWGL